jgi:chromate transporter
MTPLSDLFRAFSKIGLLSFGGPVAQIGVMHRELVEHRGWLTDDQFSRGLSFSMLLPGPEAMQLCTYAGWRLRGTLGGLVAGALFVLPGAAFMAAITLAYLRWGNLPGVAPAFLGIKAAVLIVVAQALVRLGLRTLTTLPSLLLASAAFALLLLGLPFPFVVLGAALYGGRPARLRSRSLSGVRRGPPPFGSRSGFPLLPCSMRRRRRRRRRRSPWQISSVSSPDLLLFPLAEPMPRSPG